MLLIFLRLDGKEIIRRFNLTVDSVYYLYGNELFFEVKGEFY